MSALISALAGLLSVATPKANYCLEEQRLDFAQIAQDAEWIALGSISMVQTEQEEDFCTRPRGGVCTGGRASGQATLQVRRMLKGAPPDEDRIQFRWTHSWQDVSPLETGFRPQRHQTAVLWSSRKVIDGRPAACIAGAPSDAR